MKEKTEVWRKKSGDLGDGGEVRCISASWRGDGDGRARRLVSRASPDGDGPGADRQFQGGSSGAFAEILSVEVEMGGGGLEAEDESHGDAASALVGSWGGGEEAAGSAGDGGLPEAAGLAAPQRDVGDGGARLGLVAGEGGAEASGLAEHGGLDGGGGGVPLRGRAVVQEGLDASCGGRGQFSADEGLCGGSASGVTAKHQASRFPLEVPVFQATSRPSAPGSGWVRIICSSMSTAPGSQ